MIPVYLVNLVILLPWLANSKEHSIWLLPYLCSFIAMSVAQFHVLAHIWIERNVDYAIMLGFEKEESRRIGMKDLEQYW